MALLLKAPREGRVKRREDVMRTCSAAEFAKRWPGNLHAIDVPRDLVLPESCRTLLTQFGLPREVSIVCYNDTTWRFSGTATPLAEICSRDLQRGQMLGDIPAAWDRFWHLADEEYCQGGGWVCIEATTGRLVVIDLDARDQIYLISSSVEAFYTTLAHFLAWSEETGGSPAETVRLCDALRGQNCIPPAELEPFWLNLIDATLDCETMNLIVTVS